MKLAFWRRTRTPRLQGAIMKPLASVMGMIVHEIFREFYDSLDLAEDGMFCHCGEPAVYIVDGNAMCFRQVQLELRAAFREREEEREREAAVDEGDDT